MKKRYIIIAGEFNKFEMAIRADDIKFYIDDRITTDDYYAQIYIQDKPGENKLVYTEDHVIDLKYICISGNECDENYNLLTQKIQSVKYEDVIQLFKHNDKQARIFAIYSATILGREKEDPIVLNHLLQTFDDPEPEVRSATIVSYGYLRWPQLLEKIQSLCDKDSNEDIRSQAKNMLDLAKKY